MRHTNTGSEETQRPQRDIRPLDRYREWVTEE